MTLSRDFPGKTLLLEAAVDSASNGIVISDAGRPDCPVIYVNPAFTTITGYAYEEAVGRNCRFLQGDQQDQPPLQTLRKHLAEGRDCQVILRNFKKDGTAFWNELRIAPIKSDESIRFFVGVQTDVTQRVEAVEKSRVLQRSLAAQNRELEELSKSRSEFLGMAAHDLRNPLAAIALLSQTLRDHAMTDVTPMQDKLISRIRDSADHMLTLVDGLLDVTRIDSGQMDLEVEAFSLVELVTQSVELHQQRAEKKNIALDLDLSTADSITVELDKNKTRQVLDNLIWNALKYSPSGSTTTVTLEADANEVRILVADTGQGIPEADLERVFEPFGRASTTKTTAGEQSTGLGLAISRRIVEAQGGTLEVESIVGKGSTFTVHLPPYSS